MKIRTIVELGFFTIGVVAFFFASHQKFTLAVAWIGIVFGLLLAIRASETAIVGIEGVSGIFGFTAYVAGVLSSLASNTPELIIGGLAAIDGLGEFAVSMVVVATGFNLLLVGLVIIIGAKRKGYMEVPEEVMHIEVPAMRLTFTMMMALFAIAISKEAFYEKEAHIPVEAAILMVVTYLVYLVFILHPRYTKRSEKSKNERIIEEKAHGHSKNVIITLLLLGFGGIFIAGEIISEGVKHLVGIGGW